METSGKATAPSKPKKLAPEPLPEEEWTDEIREAVDLTIEAFGEPNGMPRDILKDMHDSMAQGMKAQGQPVEPTSLTSLPSPAPKAKTSSSSSSALLKGERLDLSALHPALLRRRERLKSASAQ